MYKAIATVMSAAPRGDRATNVVMEVSQDPAFAVTVAEDGAKTEHDESLFGSALANFAHGQIEVMVSDAAAFALGAKFHLTFEAM